MKKQRLHLALLVLVPTFALVGACKRRALEAAPAPLASEAPEATHAIPVAPPSPEPLQPGHAITPSAATFADGGAPKGYERASVWDLLSTSDGAAVLLLDARGTTVLPIFVGGTEALTIRLRMAGERYKRPLTHDLLSSIVKELGAEPVKAQIDDLREETYFGSLFVRQGDRILQLDARPSDAIAVALGSGTPIYVAHALMLSSGVPRAQIENEAKAGGSAIETQRKGDPTSL